METLKAEIKQLKENRGPLQASAPLLSSEPAGQVPNATTATNEPNEPSQGRTTGEEGWQSLGARGKAKGRVKKVRPREKNAETQAVNKPATLAVNKPATSASASDPERPNASGCV